MVNICDLCIENGVPFRMPGRKDGEYWCQIEMGLKAIGEGTYREDNPDDLYDPSFKCTFTGEDPPVGSVRYKEAWFNGDLKYQRDKKAKDDFTRRYDNHG